MKKKIWIFNHYATSMYKEKSGRHYYFSKYLNQNNYETTVFSANTLHNTNETINTEGKKYIIKKVDSLPFVFIKTPPYFSNGIKRVKNMIAFYLNLFTVSKSYAKEHGKPDAIIASSVHPLTMVAGIQIAKLFKVECICEVRDLWPESIVAYSNIKKTNPIIKLLYRGEKWIYEKADKLIFTMEGGKDYIVNQKWDINNGGKINLNKVYHLNNGVDLTDYTLNREQNNFLDYHLDNEELFNVVYAGSIRKVNNLSKLINIANELQKSGDDSIRILIFGEGTEKENLERMCIENSIYNVTFKGRVERKYIPSIVSKSDINYLHFDQNELKKYGASLNKLFEYIAALKPILSDCEFGYDLIEKYNLGVVIDGGSPAEIANEIINIKRTNNFKELSANLSSVAEIYDYKALNDLLINIIETKDI